METIYQKLQQIAVDQSDKTAIIVDGESYTYAQLINDVDATATHIARTGIKAGDPVALVFPNSYEFVVAALAVFANNAVLIPLNPSFPFDELTSYLDSAEAKAVFFQTGQEAAQEYVKQNLRIAFNEIKQDDKHDSFKQYDHGAVSCAIQMFSSGSTGKSKRVTRSQEAILAEFEMMSSTASIRDNEVILCTVPLYHAHGFGNALMLSLLSGSTLVILTNEFNGRKTLQALSDYKVTVFPAVPFMHQIMALTKFKQSLDLSQLKLVISAGAPLTRKIYTDLYNTYGISISQLYGSSETGALTVNLDATSDSCTAVGQPLNGVTVEIRDEMGGILPNGEEGEVWLQSPAMTSQYDNLPEITRECFRDGWFFAGDLGVLDDNGLSITGRKKLLINVAGNKVDPLEVEEVINSHPGVVEGVVVGKNHKTYGEQITAYVVAGDHKPLDDSDLLHFCKERLVEYKVPKHIKFIEQIPRSPLGKVLRKYLN